MVPKAEIEGEMGDTHVGLQALSLIHIYNALFFLLFLAVVIVQVIQGAGGQDKQRSADPGDIVKIDKP